MDQRDHWDDSAITGTLDEAEQQLLDSGDDARVGEYLAAGFVAAAVVGLAEARHRAGLTQAQVAQRMHTKQSSIARLEADHTGSVTLRRYIEYLRVCGMQAFDIVPVSQEEMRAYVRGNPGGPRTQQSFDEWRATVSPSCGDERDGRLAEIARTGE